MRHSSGRKSQAREVFLKRSVGASVSIDGRDGKRVESTVIPLAGETRPLHHPRLSMAELTGFPKGMLGPRDRRAVRPQEEHSPPKPPGSRRHVWIGWSFGERTPRTPKYPQREWLFC